jgi:hypothetical protein
MRESGGVNSGDGNMWHSGLTYLGAIQSSENANWNLERLFIEEIINTVNCSLN